MSSGLSFLNDFLESRLNELHTCMPCKVLKYDEYSGTADVVPLFMRKFKDKSAEQMPPMLNVPVSKRKYKLPNGDIEIEKTYYEKGDIVVVVFSERALDKVMSGQISDPVYNRKHALEDAIIIGLLG